MVSMTPEEAQQAETVARIRKERTAIGRDFDECEQLEEAKDYDRLLEIVDSQARKIEAMQKQLNAYSLLTEAAGSLMQKQYTEDELRAEFERQYESIMIEEARKLSKAMHSAEVARELENDYLIGWLHCARFLGAIKEQGET